MEVGYDRFGSLVRNEGRWTNDECDIKSAKFYTIPLSKSFIFVPPAGNDQRERDVKTPNDKSDAPFLSKLPIFAHPAANPEFGVKKHQI